VLLLTKILLFVALGAAGWWHRRATIPVLHRSESPARSRAFWRLAGVEVLLMGAVMGVAVALGSSAPPVPQDPVAEPGPAFDLTGYPAPPPPSVVTYLTQWRPDILFASLAVAGVVVYLTWA
ncbi:CopD family protein, partial [Georgenia sp. 10Sc9-8]|nr:CopD family protein [Georgenia halotolerans]